MLVKIDCKNFEKEMRKINHIIDKKASLEILNFILIQVMPELLTLQITASNLEMGYKLQYSADLVENFPADSLADSAKEQIISTERKYQSFCVPGKKFYEIIKNFGKDEVILELEGRRFIIRDAEGSMRFELNTADANEYPEFPDIENSDIEKTEVKFFEIRGSVLAELIDKTIFCTTKDETNFVLNGICFELLGGDESKSGKNKLRLVASDGVRLAYCEREIEEIENASSVLFDRRFVVARVVARKVVSRIMEIVKNENVVKLGFIDNYVVVRTANSFFYAQVMEESFPDYRQVIPDPEEAKRICKVDRRAFLHSLKRAVLMSTEKKTKPVIIDFSERITVRTEENELGDVRISLDVFYDGKPVTVTYNALYLFDVLSKMKSEEVELRIISEEKPTIITGYRDEGFLYVLMPLIR